MKKNKTEYRRSLSNGQIAVLIIPPIMKRWTGKPFPWKVLEAADILFMQALSLTARKLPIIWLK